MMIRKLLVLMLASTLVGCAPLVPVTDLSKVTPTELSEAIKIRVFTVESSTAYPAYTTILGEVTSYSCKLFLSDPPASKADALKRLRLEALKLQADAIIDVTFDTSRADAFGTNCWEMVSASGQAVKLK